MLISDLIRELDFIAPPDLADEGDCIGFQVGDGGAEVNKICVALDTTDAIIKRAIANKANMLVTHHPLIRPNLKTVTASDPISRRVMELVRTNTALFVMHTNFDAAPGGTNDVLAEMLEVFDGEPLIIGKQDHFYKIVVFVPIDYVDIVRDAMADAGAGRIGQYTHCSFSTPGTGSFVPLQLASPFIGTEGKLEEVEEMKLEMVCAGSWLNEALEAMVEKHPYDEVAYDIYQLANEPVTYGYGRVGVLRSPVSLKEFADRVYKAVNPKYLKVEGDINKQIQRVALCTGSGSGLWKNAARAQADVYVTGDTKYHDILDANSHGLAVIDAGHHDTEAPAMRKLAEKLNKGLAGFGVEVEYID